MKIYSYITRKLTVQILFFSLLTAGAWIFDSLRSADTVVLSADSHQEEDPASSASTYFCSPPSGYSIKVPVQKSQPKKYFGHELTQKLIGYQTARNYYTYKAENVEVPQQMLTRHLTAFRYYHFGSPDDVPPVV